MSESSNDAKPRRFRRTKRVVGELSGASVGIRAVNSTAGLMTGSYERSKRMLSSLKPQDGGVAIDGRLLPAEERYRLAAEVNGLSEAGEAEILRNTFDSFWLYAVVCAFAFVAGCWSLYAYPPTDYSVFFFFTRFMALPIALVLCARAAHLNYAVRQRALVGFLEWLRGPSLPARSA